VKEIKSVILAELIEETLELLRATLPATIKIHSELERELSVPGDPVQLQQIVMNLCTNAGLALSEKGGDLDLALSSVEVDADANPKLGLKTGSYARLTVSDNGCGMSEEVKSRIFDPFFTTREQGKGTGMGLSVVHGIITQMAGAVTVYSTPGQGTTFNIFLPLSGDGHRRQARSEDIRVSGGDERILFVDDESIQRDIGREILEYLGYGVTICRSSVEALELFRSSPDAFDLLISDVTMPDMTGDMLVEKIWSLRPALPVLLCTGYSERRFREKLESRGRIRIVMKPLLLQELSVNIRAILEDKD
jgi:CheY-like chemotaxis protein